MASKRKRSSRGSGESKRRSKRVKKHRKTKRRSHRSKPATVEHGDVKRRSRRKGTSRRKVAVPRGIPVEGLVGAGVIGRYPSPAKVVESFTTKSWRPVGNQDLEKTDIVQFHLKVPPGQLIR